MTRGIESRYVDTRRRRTHVRAVGEPSGETVVFVHGNLSESTVWCEQLRLLPPHLGGVAADLRGFGDGDAPPIDATRGLGDHRDDLVALLDALGLDRVHLVGHSMGGGVVADLATHHPERVATLTLVTPLAPHGFGGTDLDGRPYAPDLAGTGGGAVNPRFVERILLGDEGDEDPAAPRNVVRALYFPGQTVDEDVHVAAMLRTRIGDDHYPGDSVPSPHWPGFAPGTRGVLNSMSAKYFSWARLAETASHVPVLWVRGDLDVIVSDTSMSDVGQLGRVGAVPGWPGSDVFDAQPMIAQTRRVLDAHGDYREVVMSGTGHFPYAQRPTEFASLVSEHVARFYADHR
ncbi:alpha/beta fold hydrolase [Stackebrandtia soli]|uniref:alpha/beta hydrolase n=1 Tax=Stackebrandtia soli TaxID=1892856 RepID=UPI0039E932B7